MGELFGVSRTPVREAFKTLAAEGVIELLPRRGAVVRVAFSDREVEYLMRARSAVWRLTMEALAEVATDDELEVLSSMVSEMRNAYSSEDVERFYHVVDTYYLSIERIAGIPVLSDLLNRVQRLGRLIRRFKIGAATDMRLYVELAERLLEAIKARDISRVNALTEEGSRQVLALTDVAKGHPRIADGTSDHT
jgi:DNA-binding GntR family transcriptional regulator